MPALIAAPVDVKARNAVVEANLGLVHALAGRYAASGVPIEDLVQEGTIGLIRAAELYRPETGWRFSTYSRDWILNYLRRASARGTGPIDMPVHALWLAAEYRRTAARLAGAGARRPRRSEVIAAMGPRTARKMALLKAVVRVVHAHAADPAVLEGLHARPADMDPIPSGRVATALEELPEAERAILEGHYGRGETMAAVAAALGLSTNAAVVLRGRALRRMRILLTRAGPEGVRRCG